MVFPVNGVLNQPTQVRFKGVDIPSNIEERLMEIAKEHGKDFRMLKHMYQRYAETSMAKRIPEEGERESYILSMIEGQLEQGRNNNN